MGRSVAQKASSKLRAQRLFSEGKCVKCRKPREANRADKKLCRSCTSRAAVMVKANRRKRHAELVSEGKCTLCKRIMDKHGKICCICTKRNSENLWRWKQRNRDHAKRCGRKPEYGAIRPWNFGTDSLIEEHVGLARKLARRVAAKQFSGLVDLDEISGDAMLGLVVAGRTFDATYGATFESWATRQINAAIYRGIRTWTKCRFKERPIFVPLQEWGDDAAA